ncbi:MAG: hypothetical protein J0I84_01415 [Terrimonas sp.]|nr:hypothetical protein [Terrimonas sp.]
MKKRFSIIIPVLLVAFSLCAQQNNEAAGTYFLQDVKDTNSGFTLKPNYTFTFFYTKDQFTRTGSGRWTLDNNIITFNSRLKPARDFKLLSSRSVNDNFITIAFTDDNPLYIKDIECTLYTARGRQKKFTNAEGIVQFTKQEIDSVKIISSFFPDHPFTYIPLNKIQNNFVFELEKWISEVFFSDFTLQFSNPHLSGRHPLLPGQFRYTKDN